MTEPTSAARYSTLNRPESAKLARLASESVCRDIRRCLEESVAVPYTRDTESELAALLMDIVVVSLAEWIAQGQPPDDRPDLCARLFRAAAVFAWNETLSLEDWEQPEAAETWEWARQHMLCTLPTLDLVANAPNAEDSVRLLATQVLGMAADQWPAVAKALICNRLQGWKDWRDADAPIAWTKDTTASITKYEPYGGARIKDTDALYFDADEGRGYDSLAALDPTSDPYEALIGHAPDRFIVRNVEQTANPTLKSGHTEPMQHARHMVSLDSAQQWADDVVAIAYLESACKKVKMPPDAITETIARYELAAGGLTGRQRDTPPRRFSAADLVAFLGPEWNKRRVDAARKHRESRREKLKVELRLP